MADKGRRSASYEGDLTDGMRREAGHARSTAAPAEAEPGRAGSPVTHGIQELVKPEPAGHFVFGYPRTTIVDGPGRRRRWRSARRRRTGTGSGFTARRASRLAQTG